VTPVAFPAFRAFSFNIAPNTPVKDLLPAAPPTKKVDGPVLTDELARVPEAEFEALPEKFTNDGKQVEAVAHQLAKINHMNAKKTDAFMTALLASRDDLSGLPFAMGDSCRTSFERTKQFTQAVAVVRQALTERIMTNAQVTTNGVPSTAAVMSDGSCAWFWQNYKRICEREDASLPRGDKATCEHVTLARIAALTQIMMPESAEYRLGLVKYLTGVPHVEATKSLARMALFSTEEDIRAAAIESLKVRREQDYTDILVKGLRYPWPAVAKNAANAIARMGRSDLIPDLVAVLETDDPRLPETRTVEGKPTASVRELVKVNHHRNCMMCHSPGNPSTVSGNAITAEVPIPGQPMQPPSQGYGTSSSPDLMVRIDVTYLRQDFSMMLPVKDARPWPEMQRFDFLIRERKVTAEEAKVYKEKLTPSEEGTLSPFHKAALAALRDLTGKDTAPTAEAWRKLLKLPPSSKS
jgi:hypothetical protein